jgi:hypothetical protein
MSHPIATEHEFEPIPGLPEQLPAGERIVWQGRPESKPFARQVMKNRWLLGYFVLLMIWAIVAAIYDGRTVASIIFSVSVLGLLAAAIIGLCELYAWAVHKTTLYTITNRRIVMRIGAALSMTLNVPFRQIAAVNRTESGDGSGTLTVQLLNDQRFSWLVLWPHARPWRFAQPEPALRCIPEIEKVTEVLLAQLTEFSASDGPTQIGNAITERPPKPLGFTPELAAG